jgi:hypothetical protein
MASTVARTLAITVALASALAGDSRGQCPDWSPSLVSQGTDKQVAAFAAFDDGTGVALYAGGDFTIAGGISVSHIARWNGTHWAPLGLGVGSGTHWPYPAVSCLVPADLGSGTRLYAAGDFTSAGGTRANHVAQWDGSSWALLGSGMDDDVHALVAFDDGSGVTLYAGSDADFVRRWNGTAWTEVPGLLGSTLFGAYVLALTTFDDGSGPALYVGGSFTTVGGMPANNVARWNGSSWSPLGTGVDDIVSALAVFDDGTGAALYAGGYFGLAGGVSANRVAKWNGSSWSPLGSGVDNPVGALCVFDDGSGAALYVGGSFVTAGGATANHIAKWNGVNWTGLGSGTNQTMFPGVAALGVFDGESGPALYVGGDFNTAGGSPARNIAVWQGCNEEGAIVCPGDGSGGPCPCANTGSIGHGCNNSAATGGALLTATGWASLAHDQLELASSGELPSALSVILQGRMQIAPTSFGDGLLCAGGALKRLYIKHAVSGIVTAPQPGDLSVSARSAALGDHIQVGQSRVYQVYYRDPNLTFCPPPMGNGWNVSSGLRIGWLP